MKMYELIMLVAGFIMFGSTVYLFVNLFFVGGDTTVVGIIYTVAAVAFVVASSDIQPRERCKLAIQ